MIYLDNAATGGFKPASVIDTAISVIKYLNANVSRSAHALSQTAGNYVYSARKKTAEFFGVSTPSRVIFTKNCTESLNIAIHGGIKGGTVITSTLEHNSVLRPLYNLEKKGIINLKIVKPSNEKFLTATDVENNFDKTVSSVVINSASNVTGEVSKIYEIGEFLKNKNVFYIVDGAQAGGHIKINLKDANIDALALACHKGLYSIGGLGALLLSNRAQIEPLCQGGTGTESFNPYQPDVYPERLESGTLNLPAICTLEEGLKYIEGNVSYVSKRLEEMTAYLCKKLEEIQNVSVYSRKNPVGIVSFSISGISSGEVSEILSSKYDIAVRGGYHCAPLIHKMLKTEDDGLIRASLSLHNTKREANALIFAVKEIANCF